MLNYFILYCHCLESVKRHPLFFISMQLLCQPFACLQNLLVDSLVFFGLVKYFFLVLEEFFLFLFSQLIGEIYIQIA